jgi:hypothetical protein
MQDEQVLTDTLIILVAEYYQKMTTGVQLMGRTAHLLIAVPQSLSPKLEY